MYNKSISKLELARGRAWLMAAYEGVNYSVFLQVMTSLQINNSRLLFSLFKGIVRLM